MSKLIFKLLDPLATDELPGNQNSIHGVHDFVPDRCELSLEVDEGYFHSLGIHNDCPSTTANPPGVTRNWVWQCRQVASDSTGPRTDKGRRLAQTHIQPICRA